MLYLLQLEVFSFKQNNISIYSKIRDFISC
jgi:hypothetical protein